MWEDLTKKWVKKTKKNLSSAGPGTRQRGPLPSAWKWHSAKKGSLPSAGPWHSAKALFAECQGRHSAKNFFKKKLTAWAGSAVKCHFFCRVPLFAECCTRQRGLLPSAALCRVPGTLWHSAKPLFAECQTLPSATRSGTRQRVASPSARFLALGKAGGTRQICVLPQ